ncbi:MAG: arylamine N-acetyltransferase [Chloroflexota bacterium]
MNIRDYLTRIDFPHPIRTDADTLRALQRAHILTIPFENLDIVPLGKPIRLDLESLWDKIVVRKRGGFCYELNGLFAWLLKQIGFDVTHLNARVYNDSGELGIEFDHLVLLTTIPNQSTRWLADVGFGDSNLEPLNLDKRGEQTEGLRAYRVESLPNGYVMWERDYDGKWARQFFFDLQPRNFPSDYESACRYHQTSPESSFTRGSIISRATQDGRVSLEDDRLIVTTNGQRAKRPVVNDEEYRFLLKEHFGVEL